jgi:hypothetical protein
VLSDGRIILLGDQGHVAVSNDDGRSFTVKKIWTGSLTDLVETLDGNLWVSGVFGIRKFNSQFSSEPNTQLKSQIQADDKS